MLLSSLLVNSHNQILSSLPMDLKNILWTKLSTLEDMEKVINTSSVGLVMVPNMTDGFLAPRSPTAKHLMFGREGQMQPLGSFFPLGFLTPPDREPFVDVVIFILSFYIMHDFNFAPHPPALFFYSLWGCKPTNYLHATSHVFIFVYMFTSLSHYGLLTYLIISHHISHFSQILALK